MNSQGPVQSIDRVFDIVETLASSPRGFSLSILAQEVKLPICTTHRLLHALTLRGYVQKDVESGKYRLTMKLFEMGSQVAGGLNLVSVSRPFLEHLSDVTNETIHLVSRDSDEVIYLYKQDSSNNNARISSFVGLKNPMYCTAVGKCILSVLPSDEVQAIWNRTNITAFTKNTITSFDVLKAELQTIRERGYAFDNEEHELGVQCIAAPIFDFKGEPVAAISVSLPASRAISDYKEVLSTEITNCAASISKQLGFRQ